MREVKTSREQARSSANGGAKTNQSGTPVRTQRRPMLFLAGGATAIGVAWAAAFTSRSEVDPRVGVTAWIAAAIVGTAATISAAKSS